MNSWKCLDLNNKYIFDFYKKKNRMIFKTIHLLKLNGFSAYKYSKAH